jgi:hypothetical protein
MDDIVALRLQIKSGVQHEHVRAAREQRPGAGGARRSGTDDTVHNYFIFCPNGSRVMETE